jgi:hypothetical protein
MKTPENNKNLYYIFIIDKKCACFVRRIFYFALIHEFQPTNAAPKRKSHKTWIIEKRENVCLGRGMIIYHASPLSINRARKHLVFNWF